MVPHPSVSQRCSNICKGIWVLNSQTIAEFIRAGIASSSATVHRLLTGSCAAHWDMPAVEAAIAFISRICQIPRDDVIEYMHGRPCAFTAELAELELARFIVPSSQWANEIRRKCAKFEEAKGDIYAYMRFLPPALTTEECVEAFLYSRTRPLGKMGARLFGASRRFAGERRERFLNDGLYAGSRLVLLVPYSCLIDMKTRTGPFGGLSDDGYAESVDSLIVDTVDIRDVKLGLFDDRRLPEALRRRLARYEGLMTLDNRFAMSIHPGWFRRGFCERTTVSSQCNDFIDELRHTLMGLEKWVEYDLGSKAKRIQAIEPFRF